MGTNRYATFYILLYLGIAISSFGLIFLFKARSEEANNKKDGNNNETATKTKEYENWKEIEL